MDINTIQQYKYISLEAYFVAMPMTLLPEKPVKNNVLQI